MRAFHEGDGRPSICTNHPTRDRFCYSPSKASAWLLTELARLDMELGCAVWVDRVASASTPADGPSRFEFGRVPKLAGGRFQHVEAPMLEEDLLASRKRLGA